MNKEDILKLSRAENKNGDEREQKVRLRSYATSAFIGLFLCIIASFIEDIIFDRSAALLWIIYYGMQFSKSMFEAVKLKNKMDAVLSVVFGLGLVIESIHYVLDNIG